VERHTKTAEAEERPEETECGAYEQRSSAIALRSFVFTLTLALHRLVQLFAGWHGSVAKGVEPAIVSSTPFVLPCFKNAKLGIDTFAPIAANTPFRISHTPQGKGWGLLEM
jgi:hypothetical protein